MKRYVCIFLVLALLISCTVYPVKAFGVATVSVALDAFISAVLIGLGLMPTPGNDTAFNQLVTSCKEFLQTASIVAADSIILLSPSTGMTYAKRNIIEKIKDWLFSSKTIAPVVELTSEPVSEITWYTFSDGTRGAYYNNSLPVYADEVFFYTGSGYLGYRFLYSGAYFNGSANADYSSGVCFRVISNSSTTYDGLLSMGFRYVGSYSSLSLYIEKCVAPTLGETSILVPEGISVSDVVPKVDEDIIITFPDWKELEKQVQEGEGGSEDPSEPTNPPDIPYVPYWPIWSPQFSNPDATLDEVTQEVVWNKGADPSWDPDNSGGNTGSSSGSAPPLPEMSIDLRDFFPFCIPFDIYNLVTMFVAEPVAPVFEWEIPVPRLGKSFELEIDLSAWDGIAQLFRSFELIGFIIGLGWITREKILRG